jgi:hypothetical protein
VTFEGKEIIKLNADGAMHYSFDSSSLAPGMYLVNAHFGTNTLQRLFVKQ